MASVNDDDLWYPPFVCMLDLVGTCPKPRVLYPGQLRGCTAGFHPTSEDLANNLAGLFRKMADVIINKHGFDSFKPSEPCGNCLAPINPSASTPVAYMEACFHHFHPGCIVRWQDSCPGCALCWAATTNRVLLWPELFDTQADKDQVFQWQKRGLGLWIGAKTDLTVSEVGGGNLSVFLPGGKHLKLLRKSHRMEPQDATTEVPGQEKPVAQEQVDAKHHRTKWDTVLERSLMWQLLTAFECPFESAPSGFCSLEMCPFFHATPGDELDTSQVRNYVRPFPDYFCLDYSLYKDMLICEDACLHQQVKLHPQELARCSVGFHLSLEDLDDLEEFYTKMAKQIMDEASLILSDDTPQDPICAFCHSSANLGVWAHFENCEHCFHGQCFPSQPEGLDFDCPTCLAASHRVRLWPTGHLPSKSMKQWYFDEQRKLFDIQVKDDTGVVVVEESANPNWFRIRTIDREVRFNVDQVQDEQVFWMDELEE